MKWNETKRNEMKQNEMKRNKTKLNENEMKRNETKRNEMKGNEMGCNEAYWACAGSRIRGGCVQCSSQQSATSEDETRVAFGASAGREVRALMQAQG